MLADIDKFLPDIQSINQTGKTGFILFGINDKEAAYIKDQLLSMFNIPSVLDIDNDRAHCVVPLADLDDTIISKFSPEWSWYRDKKFIQYLITFYNEDTANQFFNILTLNEYNVILEPNNMQLTITCIADSPHNTKIIKLGSKFLAFEKTSPQNINTYFNKVLFNGVIENTEYHKLCGQTFNIEAIKRNKDLIIREILYRYFNKNIRTLLISAKSSQNFDANKLSNKTTENINLVHDFLYSVAEKYIDAQINDTPHPQQTIKFDYLATSDEYSNFRTVLKHAQKWQRENRKKAKREQRDISASLRGTYKLMNLPNDYYVVHLGSQAAFNYESKTLGHHTDIYYMDDIYNGFGWYSIRQGYKPILTLEVRKGNEVQCYGYKNEDDYNEKLRDAIRAFMNKRNLTIPNNSCNSFLGYIKIKGIVHDIFNLGQNTVLDDSLNLDKLGLKKIPNMSTVTITKGFSIRDNKLHDFVGAPRRVCGDFDASNNPLDSLLGIPYVGGRIFLTGTKLKAESFVPDYIEDKLKNGDIFGVSDEIKAAWLYQIEERRIHNISPTHTK